VDDGLFIRRDPEGGQMSRDMTLFVDDDGKSLSHLRFGRAQISRVMSRTVLRTITTRLSANPVAQRQSISSLRRRGKALCWISWSKRWDGGILAPARSTAKVEVINEQGATELKNWKASKQVTAGKKSFSDSRTKPAISVWKP
jgi:hypothetical protein